MITINLDEILTIFGCVAIGILAVNYIFYFLTPKDQRPDFGDFDPWDTK